MKQIKEFNIGDEIPHNATFLCSGEKTAKGGVNRTKQVFYYELPIKSESSGKSDAKEKQTIETIKRVIDYLNNKTGSKFTHKAKAHSAKIRARLNEGATPEQFKECIDNKVADWLDDPEWRKFLRPETLFGNKFWGYISAKSGKQELDEAFDEIDSILEGGSGES